MTTKLSIAGLVVAAAASSAITFGVAPANSACLTSAAGNNCATFDGSSASNALFNGFTDATFAANVKITDISFDAVNITGDFPIALTGLEYSFDNFSTPGTAFNLGTYTISAAGTGPDLLGGVVFAPGGQIGDNFAVRATLPAGIYTPTSGARFIRINIGSNNSVDTLPQSQTRLSTPVETPTGTPSPLPLLGAGAAFGYSRRLRKQIKQIA